MILPKVLVTDGVHEILLEKLKEENFEVVYSPKISLEEVRDQIQDFTGLIINSKILVDEDLLKRAPKLKWIGRLGSGIEIIDFSATKNHGIAVESCPEGNRNAVAEHMLGMLLSLLNHLPRIDKEVRDEFWDREGARGEELIGKTVGLIGFGNTGRSFATKLQGMGVEVLAYDKYFPHFEDHFPFVKSVQLKVIQQKADIISLHLPLTLETKGYVDSEFIGKCKNRFILLNSSRGACVKTQDLVEGLENGKCRGACLDVFENERPAAYNKVESLLYQRLFSLSNVMLSPHVAGWTKESKYKLGLILFEKLQKHFSRN
ncbi:MAG: hypothetical protein HKN16_10510 [Saprospiraceae bacterium]|nr:hypothetical protein [Saprospiraceae bacterium]